MPGPILHVGASVQCLHGGQATPTSFVPRVTFGTLAAATIAAPYSVVACPFAPPGGNGPCVTGPWIVGASRVFVLSQPVAIMTGGSTTTPSATPLLPVSAQLRVTAT
jgi:hypothetical protein